MAPSYRAAEAVKSLGGGHTGSDEDQDFEDHDSEEKQQMAASNSCWGAELSVSENAQTDAFRAFHKGSWILIMIMKYVWGNLSHAGSSTVLDKKFCFASRLQN